MASEQTIEVDARQAVRCQAEELTGTHEDYDSLLERIGDARLVLLGEASHGTHDFYRERARITQRLITERGFDAVAIEGDWPDAYRVNRFVQDAASEDAGLVSGTRSTAGGAPWGTTIWV